MPADVVAPRQPRHVDNPLAGHVYRTSAHRRHLLSAPGALDLRDEPETVDFGHNQIAAGVVVAAACTGTVRAQSAAVRAVTS
jgi:hypothetical protein